MKFLTRARLRGYSRVLVGFYVVFWVGWFVASTGLLGLHDSPPGSDFLVLYTGSRLSIGSDPAAAYDLTQLLSAASRIVGAEVELGPWLYPPVFATIMVPFAYMPYLVAVPAWVVLTGIAYIFAVGKTYNDKLTPWIAAAFLATLENAMGGQNGFLSAAFFGFGLYWLRSAPIFAGILLGLLLYKPQLAALVPAALLFGRQWRALFGFVAGAVAVTGLSLIVVGWDGWLAFFGSIPAANKLLEGGGPTWFKMPTVFVATRLLGLAVPVAQVCQLTVSFITLAVVAWVWARPTPFALKAAALGLGSLLVAPYTQYYDWTVLAVPVAWLVSDMAARGIKAWHVWVIAIAYVFPMLGPIVAALSGIQLGPFVLMAILAAVVVRTRHSEKARYRQDIR